MTMDEAEKYRFDEIVKGLRVLIAERMKQDVVYARGAWMHDRASPYKQFKWVRHRPMEYALDIAIKHYVKTMGHEMTCKAKAVLTIDENAALNIILDAGV
jgi:hypothetical protein